MNPAYFYVGLPCNYDRYSYNYKPKDMGYNTWKIEVEALKPKTPYMSFVVFKVISYTPQSQRGGIITTPKTVPPSLIVETMDGRRMEAYQFHQNDPKYSTNRDYISLSDAVLNEVARNFVHPELNLKNFKNYSRFDADYEREYRKDRRKKQEHAIKTIWKMLSAAILLPQHPAMLLLAYTPAQPVKQTAEYL